jgi:uncharacterized protein
LTKRKLRSCYASGSFDLAGDGVIGGKAMLRLKLSALCLALGLGYGVAPLAAQPAPPASDASLAAAKDLIVAMHATDQFRAILPNIMQALKPAVVQGRPDAEKDFNVIVPVIVEGMSARVNELASELAGVYARNFTVDELNQLAAFYRSPVGEALVAKTPVITQQSLVIGQAFGQKVAAEMQTRIAEEMRKRGHQ